MLSQDAQQALSLPATLSTSYLPSEHAPSSPPSLVLEAKQSMQRTFSEPVRIQQYNNIGSTAKGIMIGIFSVLGAAGLVLILAAIVYYFRYTQQGRIFLDRITRPGEYDDEQQFAKEEAEALEEMDDIQRVEYMRAKGRTDIVLASPDVRTLTDICSLCPSQSARVRANRHLAIAVLGNTGEGRIGVGIRAGTRDRQLLRRRSDRD
jgi:hypothetical protein